MLSSMGAKSVSIDGEQGRGVRDMQVWRLRKAAGILMLAASFAPALAAGAASGDALAIDSPAPGRSPAVSRARALAAGCTTCHQPDVPGIPALNGQSRATLRAHLEGYRNGSLPGSVMPQLVRGYTPDELDLVAQWFAAERAPQ